MRVLGIDPGTIRMGYGVVEERESLAFVDCGVLEAPSRDPIEQRLMKLFNRLQDMIRRYEPATMAVEEPFVVQAPRRSGLAVGEARAIALLAAAMAKVPVFQYTPSRVRQTIASYGSSNKEQVQHMVGLLLRQPMTGYPLDACDALAVAICHLRQIQMQKLLDEQRPGRERRPAARRAPRRKPR